MGIPPLLFPQRKLDGPTDGGATCGSATHLASRVGVVGVIGSPASASPIGGKHICGSSPTGSRPASKPIGSKPASTSKPASGSAFPPAKGLNPAEGLNLAEVGRLIGSQMRPSCRSRHSPGVDVLISPRGLPLVSTGPDGIPGADPREVPRDSVATESGILGILRRVEGNSPQDRPQDRPRVASQGAPLLPRKNRLPEDDGLPEDGAKTTLSPHRLLMEDMNVPPSVEQLVRRDGPDESGAGRSGAGMKWGRDEVGRDEAMAGRSGVGLG